MTKPQTEAQEVRIAEYALGLLSAAEAKAVEADLARDPALRAAHAIWGERLVGLSEDIAPVTPPDSLWPEIERTLFTGTPVRAKQTVFQRLGVRTSVLAALAVSIGLAIVINLPGLRKGFDPAYLAQLSSGDGSLTVLAAFDPAQALLRLERTAGGAEPGRVLELWVIPDEGAPVSLGVLPEAGVSDVPVPEALQAALIDGQLGVSQEQPGGAANGAPTGDLRAIGAVTAR